MINWTHDERINLTARLHKGFPRHFPNLSAENITSRFPLPDSAKEVEEEDLVNIGCPYREYVVYPFKNAGYTPLGSLV